MGQFQGFRQNLENGPLSRSRRLITFVTLATCRYESVLVTLC